MIVLGQPSSLDPGRALRQRLVVASMTVPHRAGPDAKLLLRALAVALGSRTEMERIERLARHLAAKGQAKILRVRDIVEQALVLLDDPAHIGNHSIVKKLLKRSAGKRRHLNMPVHPELVQLLEALWSRPRRPGVETLLVNSSGSPWTGDGFGGSFNRIRDAAQIYHIDENTGARKRKHLHDIRGTFATEVITGSDLSDTKIAGLMGWSPERVRTIRRVYVDEAKVAVALDERIAGAFVKYAVKRSNDLN